MLAEVVRSSEVGCLLFTPSQNDVSRFAARLDTSVLTNRADSLRAFCSTARTLWSADRRASEYTDTTPNHRPDILIPCIPTRKGQLGGRKRAIKMPRKTQNTRGGRRKKRLRRCRRGIAVSGGAATAASPHSLRANLALLGDAATRSRRAV